MIVLPQAGRSSIYENMNKFHTTKTQKRPHIA